MSTHIWLNPVFESVSLWKHDLSGASAGSCLLVHQLTPVCRCSPLPPTAFGEPVRLEWYNPQGERIVPSRRMALHTESSRSRLIIYNAIIEDAGIYRCQATDASGHTEESSVVLEIYRKLDTHFPHI